MVDERTHLRDAVIQGVRDVDAVFRSLAEQVRRWADAFPLPWGRKVRAQVRTLVDGMLNRTIGLTIRAAMVSELHGVLARHVSLTRIGVYERLGMVADTLNAPAKLAKWTARAGRSAKQVVGKVINRGGGIPAIADVLDPAKAPLSFTRKGRVIRKPKGISPHGTSRARTAVRMEISKVHTEATLDAAGRAADTKGVRFVLSALHPKVDSCDPLAGEDRHGLGVGVYPVSKCPRPPTHVGCLCSLEVVR